jgi:hypothetical protein
MNPNLGALPIILHRTNSLYSTQPPKLVEPKHPPTNPSRALEHHITITLNNPSYSYKPIGVPPLLWGTPHRQPHDNTYVPEGSIPSHHRNTKLTSRIKITKNNTADITDTTSQVTVYQDHNSHHNQHRKCRDPHVLTGETCARKGSYLPTTVISP